MAKHALGIELGSHHLALVQLTGTGKAYTLTAAAQRPLPGVPEEEHAASWRQALQELLAPLSLRGDTVVVTLPAARAVLRYLTFPFKDPRRIRQALRFTLDEHMPFEPEEVIADFQPLPSSSDDATSLLAVATPQTGIAEALSLLQEAGLEPVIVDLDVFALAHAAWCGSRALPHHTVVLDLQPTHTLMTFLHQGTPVFARSLAYGLPSPEVPLESYVARLSKALQHSLYACEMTLTVPYTPDLLLLAGAHRDRLDILATALQEALEVPAAVWQISADAYRPSAMSPPPAEQTRYAVAFGAALRALHRHPIGINLRRERFALHREVAELRGRLVGLGLMLMAVAALGVGNLYLHNQYKAQRYAQLQREIAQVFHATLPDTRLVHPVVQMQEQLRRLSERLRAFGGLTGTALSGLQILREISARTPPTITVNVDNLTITDETIDLSGTTNAYDDVVKLKEALEASPYFAAVKITSTKTDVSSKVAFKLTIQTVKTLENLS
ncbi:MAG: hypothetical protein KatS3mg131_3717 [Candidatus Tectimicrobiota bacterium]|nr:MAG: hypothetical protein KatS3mg131_3717 [Candidatus Tectomicrobia bacterium]